MKKIFLIFGLLLLTCFILAGCETDEELPYDENTPIFNETGFDGNGMDIIIKVWPKANFDPFDEHFTGDHKFERQSHQLAVEEAYDVKVKYVDYADNEPYGPSRINAIKQGHLAGQRIGDIYQLNNLWLHQLAQVEAIAPLYNIETDSGYFKDFNFDASSIYLDLAKFQNQIYGYACKEYHPDYFMYYNYDLVKNMNLLDPAQMWLDHEWTWSNFKKFLSDAAASSTYQSNSPSLKLLSGQAVESMVGIVAAQGGSIINPKTNELLWENDSAINIINDLKTFCIQGYMDKDTNDVSDSFENGKALFATGSLLYLNDYRFFNPDLNFQIGAVPYPLSDDPYDQALEKFTTPVIDSDIFAIANVVNGNNGLNSKILFNILDDLCRDLTFEENMTPDEQYRSYLDTLFESDVTIDAIMSIQDPKYFYYEKVFTVSANLPFTCFNTVQLYPMINNIIIYDKDVPQELANARQHYLNTINEIYGESK